MALRPSWPRKIPPSKLTPIPTADRPSISGMGELHLEIIVDRMMRGIQSRSQCWQAAGGVSRDDSQARLKPKGKYIRQTGRPRPVRARAKILSSISERTGQGLRIYQ